MPQRKTAAKEDGGKGRRRQRKTAAKGRRRQRKTAAKEARQTKGNAAYPVRVDGVTLWMSVSRALA
jgi:hypothetical protein